MNQPQFEYTGRGRFPVIALQMFLILLVLGFSSFALPSAIAAPSSTGTDLHRTLAAVALRQFTHTGSVSRRAEADLNGDGIPDYAELSRASLEITIRLSGAPSQHVPLLEPAVALVVVDLDRDGDRDLVAVTGAPHVFVWLNNGFGSFGLKSGGLGSRLGPFSRSAPDLVNCLPSPVLQCEVSAGSEPAQSHGFPFQATPIATRIVSDFAAPRGPPSFFLG